MMPLIKKLQSNKKRWFRILLFFIIFAAFIYIAGEVEETLFLKANSPNKIVQKKFNEFAKLEDNTIEIAFLGSSHCESSYYPKIVEDKWGINCMNMGTSNQSPFESYAIYTHIMQTQQPKVLIIDTYFRMFENNSFMKKIFLSDIVPHFSTDTIKEMKQNFSTGHLFCYNIKYLRYQTLFRNFISEYARKLASLHEEESDMPENNTSPGMISENDLVYYKGYANKNQIVSTNELYRNNHFIDYSCYLLPSQLDLLGSLIEKAQRDGVNIILVSSPLPQISIDNIQNYDYIYESFASVSQKYSVPYIDYNIINETEHLFQEQHFKDDNHLNVKGSQIMTKDLVNRLSFLWDDAYPWGDQ